MDCMLYGHGGGPQPQLPPRQKKRWVELIEASPRVVGLEIACGHSVLIRVLIWRELSVLYKRHAVWTLLHNQQVPRSSRRNGLPVKRIKRSLLMRQEHPAGALGSLLQSANRSSGAAGVLPHPPKAFEGVEGMATMSR
jgi:hypothetical protein